MFSWRCFLIFFKYWLNFFFTEQISCAFFPITVSLPSSRGLLLLLSPRQCFSPVEEPLQCNASPSSFFNVFHTPHPQLFPKKLLSHFSPAFPGHPTTTHCPTVFLHRNSSWSKPSQWLHWILWMALTFLGGHLIGTPLSDCSSCFFAPSWSSLEHLMLLRWLRGMMQDFLSFLRTKAALYFTPLNPRTCVPYSLTLSFLLWNNQATTLMWCLWPANIFFTAYPKLLRCERVHLFSSALGGTQNSFECHQNNREQRLFLPVAQRKWHFARRVSSQGMVSPTSKKCVKYQEMSCTWCSRAWVHWSQRNSDSHHLSLWHPKELVWASAETGVALNKPEVHRQGLCYFIYFFKNSIKLEKNLLTLT